MCQQSWHQQACSSVKQHTQLSASNQFLRDQQGTHLVKNLVKSFSGTQKLKDLSF